MLAKICIALLAIPGALCFADTTSPTTPDASADLARAINQFAFDLLPHTGDSNANLIFSPCSIHLALDIAAAGAGGTTLSQMQSVLHADANTPAAAGALAGSLQSVGGDNAPILKIANALWAQSGVHWNAGYLDRVQKTFAAKLDTLDFGNPDAARQTINDWVASQTNDKIQNLIVKSAIQPGVTRLIITNAVYFKGDWLDPFSPNSTHDRPFHVRGQSDATPVPTMRETTQAAYMETDSFQAIELPYLGQNISMLILLPKTTDGLPAIESQLSPDLLTKIDQALAPQRVEISLPKFKFNASLDLAGPLAEMGMKDAFTPNTADFSSMDDSHDLYISGVVHQAFVAVDEKGTEAAAATGIMVGATAIMLPPPLSFNADHPFLFAIRDQKTGLILFLGRVQDPSN
jgi:serpin B